VRNRQFRCDHWASSHCPDSLAPDCVGNWPLSMKRYSGREASWKGRSQAPFASAVYRTRIGVWLACAACDVQTIAHALDPGGVMGELFGAA
jgi:hypothetical protein